MDFLTPGLRPRQSQSQKIIQEINNSSRISIKLKKKFKQVNQNTNDFIVNQLAIYNATLINAQPQDTASIEEFTTLQNTFQDLYYLLDVENFKFSNVSNIDISKIDRSYSKVSASYAANGINRTLNELVNSYVLLVVNSNLANSLIYKTLILKNNLVYWEEMNDSRFNKLLYFVQTSPIKLWGFSKYIYGNLQDVSYNELTTGGTEEDNQIYNTWIRFKSISKFILVTIKNTLLLNNPSVSLLAVNQKKSKISITQIWKSIYKLPSKLISTELSSRIKLINNSIDTSETHIDSLLKIDLDNNEKAISTISKVLGISHESNNENARIQAILKSLVNFTTIPDQETEMPSVLTRYWPILLILVRYGPEHGRNLYTNRDEIVRWFKYNFIDTIVGFFKNWLVKPISDMLSVLRQDDGLTITSKESLKSDLDSLERMLVDFLKDENIYGDLNQEQVHDLIQNGDLTLLMSKYEAEIRSPIKSLLKGSLVRSILIQIQKTKVDGGLAITGIDKLLKSQQLVFGIVSISPSLFIVYQLWSSLVSPKPLMVNGKQVNMLCLKSLNSIENLLILLNNNDSQQNNYEGKLLIEIINLIIISKMLIPKQLHKDWIRDLNELNNVKFDVATKLSLVRKIWNMYGHYFR